MIIKSVEAFRDFQEEIWKGDFLVVGGGMAGVCAAITAARQGCQTALVQDRPVLGGNASSEVRLWILGATSHMSNNNRWSREGGVLDEILLENLYRNPEGNPHLFDAVILDFVKREKNLRLYLNTVVYGLEKKAMDRISEVVAFCSQNSTRYRFFATQYCDASGDGALGFLSGAAFRMGAEAKEEFGEGLAPDASFGELLGHSLYFYSKETGFPVIYKAPDFACKIEEIEKIARFREITPKDFGCRLWWIEYGGRLDTVHETEDIKWKLWQVVYGLWNYIKNSGKYPEAANMTLEWVGHIPGKRESRRFEGDYMLHQSDLVQQRCFEDRVAHGGWSLDLHPADGLFSEKAPCQQYHSKGIFSIPYRSLYSRSISNLFLAGRIISASHVAFSSTRVMATCAAAAQSVGMAASICVRKGIDPRALSTGQELRELQSSLASTGHFIPSFKLEETDDLVRKAKIHASSEWIVGEIFGDREFYTLETSRAQLLPFQKGVLPSFEIEIEGLSPTIFTFEIRSSSRTESFTPDMVLWKKEIMIKEGIQRIKVDSQLSLDEPQYLFLCLIRNPEVRVRTSSIMLPGVLSVFHKFNRAVAKQSTQTAPEGSGIESFEMWIPERRPGGANIAIQFSPPLKPFELRHLTNGLFRPVKGSNAWCSGMQEDSPVLTYSWEVAQKISKVALHFDADFDHALESVLMTHPERCMPLCVSSFKVIDDQGVTIYACQENHQAVHWVVWESPIMTRSLKFVFDRPSPNRPVVVYGIRVFEK